MRKFFERIKRLISPKASQQDPAKNDQFNVQNTKDIKAKEQKLTRGDRFGKRWFPFNRG